MANNTIDPTKGIKVSAADKMPAPAETGGYQNAKSQLKELFIDNLKDMYWAEKALIGALSEMRAVATTAELIKAFSEHLDETEDHVLRLEKVLAVCNEEAEAKECMAMKGLLEEGRSVLKKTQEGTNTREAALVMAAQKIEHYEIATYGNLVEFAKTLGLQEARGYLQATLDEELKADKGLTVIAQAGIIWEAEHEPVLEQSEEI